MHAKNYSIDITEKHGSCRPIVVTLDYREVFTLEHMPIQAQRLTLRRDLSLQRSWNQILFVCDFTHQWNLRLTLHYLYLH